MFQKQPFTMTKLTPILKKMGFIKVDTKYINHKGTEQEWRTFVKDNINITVILEINGGENHMLISEKVDCGWNMYNSWPCYSIDLLLTIIPPIKKIWEKSNRKEKIKKINKLSGNS